MEYPTGDELRAFLIGNGYIAANSNESLDCDSLVASAIQQWEGDTGWVPFYAPDEPFTARYFDVPDGTLLELDGGLLWVEDFSIAGAIAPLYDLFPLNAPANGKPYTAIRFRQPLCAKDYLPGSIQIYGTWAFTTNLRDDAKNAILSMAAMTALSMTGSAAGAVTQIKQDDVQISYASSSTLTAHYSAVQLQLKATYDLAVARYKRGLRVF
jgi:hypothetical protein